MAIDKQEILNKIQELPRTDTLVMLADIISTIVDAVNELEPEEP